jgi:hypothetical protein
VATFVLVQPAWFGAWCWDKVVRQLGSEGHDVYAPTLSGLAARSHVASPDMGLSVHDADVVGVTGERRRAPSLRAHP